MKRIFKCLFLTIFIVILPITILAGCGQNNAKNIKVGIVGSQDKEIWQPIAKQLKKKGINLQIVSFSDYNQPNMALKSHEITINAFQHTVYLNNWNKANHAHLVPVGNTIFAPGTLYSKKVRTLKQLKSGAKIAISNDAVGEGTGTAIISKCETN